MSDRVIGLAFQGGSFLAGAVGAGVVQALARRRTGLGLRDIRAFTGTSAGALVAAQCWAEGLRAEPDAGALAERLREFWLTFSNGSIPNQEAGDFWKALDQIWRLNPLYDAAAELVRVPAVQAQFQSWVADGVAPDKIMQFLCGAEAKADPLPRLAVGAADLKTGGIVTFLDQDFVAAAASARSGTPWRPRRHAERHLDVSALAGDPSGGRAGAELMLQALMASGSLDELNGVTHIAAGPMRGSYVDGAWGQNPPIEVMRDMGVTEIWLVRIFPRHALRRLETHADREDRKEELWQNAMVEQQIRGIERVNGWIADGTITDARFRTIQVYAIDMDLDVTPGARIVNDPGYLKDLMAKGEAKAAAFLARPENHPALPAEEGLRR